MKQVNGKLSAKDEKLAQLLKWLPWLTLLSVSLSMPLPFLFWYLNSASTDSAAVSLLLGLAAFGVGIAIGAFVMVLLLVYRKRWHSRLRDRLASDGITASEVPWFASELTPEERRVLEEIRKTNPLLADAYSETLASRLTATRIIARTKRELLKVERRINSARAIDGADTTSLLAGLNSDQERLQTFQRETTTRLSVARARLQMIEAAASRSLSQSETDLMLRRLSESQAHFPLALEIAQLEQEAAKETALLEPDR